MHDLRDTLSIEYGEAFSIKVVGKITQTIRNLGVFDSMGASVAESLGIECDYNYIFVSHNYFFYRIEDDTVFIIEMLSENHKGKGQIIMNIVLYS